MADYITGRASTQRLATKYHVTSQAVHLHHKREGWAAKREAHRAKVLELKLAASLDESVEEAKSVFRTSEEIRATITQGARHITQRILGQFIDPVTGKEKKMDASPRALRDLVESLDKLYRLEMESAGHLTDPDRIRNQVNVLVAGVSPQQIQQLSDQDLLQAMAVRDKAKTLTAGPQPLGAENSDIGDGSPEGRNE